MDDRLATGLHTGLLIAVIGVLAWATGLPALFPSLGPSAFVLATFPESEASDTRRVVVSHAIGVVAGLATYHLFAGGIVVTSEIAPLSLLGLRLAASGVGAIVLTVMGMIHLGVRHPPACATTLIVALGLLSSPLEGVLIVAAVVVLVVVQRLLLLTDAALDRRGVFAIGRSRSD
ncbi:HPP family protein [Halococcus sp. PRR34]|uniref:HPP family protein n=1 Tax=Halococcus sp. PRR34 TaxID=3020830 RepID=UPI00235DED2E|nr:HPP family protein [Halococcus sp. PRR34]